MAHTAYGADSTCSGMKVSHVGLLTSTENANNENHEKELNINHPISVHPVNLQNENDSQDETKTSLEISQSVNTTQSIDRGQEKKYTTFTEYTKFGEPLYTDPSSKVQYKFSKVDDKWVLATAEDLEQNLYENEFYFWSQTSQKWLLKSDHIYDEKNKCWIINENISTPLDTYTIDENGVKIFKDKDGTLFQWDEVKKAWFPKIDDDFLAYYQLNYGEYKDDSAVPSCSKENSKETKVGPVNEKISDELKGRKKVNKGKNLPEAPKWFEIDNKNNTKVYVNNLPSDITEKEFLDIMSKYGENPSVNIY